MPPLLQPVPSLPLLHQFERKKKRELIPKESLFPKPCFGSYYLHFRKLVLEILLWKIHSRTYFMCLWKTCFEKLMCSENLIKNVLLWKSYFKNFKNYILRRI